MNKRQIQKEKTRKLILDSAYQVYAREGFGATTAVIAKEAGVSHGSVFVHFSNTEELLIGLLDSFAVEAGEELHGISEAAVNLREGLEAHLRVLIRYEDFYRRLITGLDDLPQQVLYTYVSIQSVASRHLGLIYEQEQMREGSDLKCMAMHRLFNTWLGLVHYYLINRMLFTKEGSVLEQYGAELVDMFLEMIRKER